MFSHTWTRIALSYAALVLLTVGVLAFLLGGELERREEEALRAELADQGRAAAYNLAPLLAQGAPITTTNTLARDLGRTFGTRVTLIRADGTVVGDSEQDPFTMDNHAGRPEVAQVIARPSLVGSDQRLSVTVNRRLLYVTVAATDPADPARVLGVARVAYPLTSVEQARDALWLNLLLTVLLVSLPAAVLGGLLVRSIAGPISTLRQVAARFGKGDLSARAHISATGEIEELSREFNSMADQLSDTIRQRTDERNQIAAVFAQMHDGIVITDPNGLITSINEAAARIFRTTPEKARDRSLIGLTHSHELHQALRNTLAKSGERQTLEVEAGSYHIEAVVTAIVSPEGGNAAGLVVLRDITELRRLERVRQDFVTNIGHELRTPLASIKLLAETLSTSIEDDLESSREFLRRIDIELDGLVQLVRELLELSKIESGRVELNRRPVPVHQLLKRASGRLRAQAERAGLSLSVQAGGDLPPVYVDVERVEQVLVNLLHNAIKFTHPGGHVTVRAERDGDRVKVSVKDTGIGIPPDDLPRIFERFYKVDKARTDDQQGEGGTGLGLAIAKHIVQAHGGQIWAESKLWHGATFYFTLPIASPEDVNNR